MRRGGSAGRGARPTTSAGWPASAQATSGLEAQPVQVLRGSGRAAPDRCPGPGRRRRPAPGDGRSCRPGRRRRPARAGRPRRREAGPPTGRRHPGRSPGPRRSRGPRRPGGGRCARPSRPAAGPRCRPRPGSRRYGASVVRRRFTRRVMGGWRFSAATTSSQSGGAFLAQLLDPPGGKAEPHLRGIPGRPSEVVVAPQEVAQHRVHQAAGRGLPQPLRRADRVVHDGVGLGPGELELGQRHEQQAPEPRVPNRGEEQLAQLGLEQAERAQALVADLPHDRPLPGAQRRMPAESLLEGRGEVAPGEGIPEDRGGAELDVEHGGRGPRELAAAAFR